MEGGLIRRSPWCQRAAEQKAHVRALLLSVLISEADWEQANALAGALFRPGAEAPLLNLIAAARSGAHRHEEAATMRECGFAVLHAAAG